jgi:hypothetical protein
MKGPIIEQMGFLRGEDVFASLSTASGKSEESKCITLLFILIGCSFLINVWPCPYVEINGCITNGRLIHCETQNLISGFSVKPSNEQHAMTIEA